jgi:hypothetical protein
VIGGGDPENDDPTLNTIGAKTVNEGQILPINLSASDTDGDVLTFSASGLSSSFMTLTNNGDNTAMLRIAPVYEHAGNYTISVGDGNGGLDSETVQITVQNVVQDSDSDGIENPDDNCPTNSNGGQGDQDSDNTGDACDNKYYVNFGASGTLMDDGGNAWLVRTATADNGSINTVTTTSYTGITNPPLCQKVIQARSGNSGRDLNFSLGNLPSGNYSLKLYFMETESTSSRRGEFDIYVEGSRKANNYEPSDEGLRVAHMETVSSSVSDGTLNLELREENGIPSICAVEITRS